MQILIDQQEQKIIEQMNGWMKVFLFKEQV